MKNIIAAFLLLVTVTAQAGDLYLDVNGYSWHSKDTYTYKGVPSARLARDREPIDQSAQSNQGHEYNTNNTGIGLTYSHDKYLEASAGFYENSYYRRSLYCGAKIKYDIEISGVTVTPALGIGVATGYVDTPAQADYFQVFVMPTLRLAYRGVGFTIGYMPRIEKENLATVATITLQFNFRVWRF